MIWWFMCVCMCDELLRLRLCFEAFKTGGRKNHDSRSPTENGDSTF